MPIDTRMCPAIGISVMVAWSIPVAVSELGKRAVRRGRIMAGRTYHAHYVSQAPIGKIATLFTHALKVTRDNFIAHENLGNVLESKETSTSR